MGLGGALLALNRQNDVEEANRRQREAQEELQRQPSGWRRFVPAFFDFFREDESQPAPPRRLPGDAEIYPGGILFNGPIDDLEDLAILRDIMDNQFGRRGPTFAVPERPREQYYKPNYTHPGKPAPGFTFDFVPPENASTSSTASPIIVIDDDEDTVAASSKASTSASGGQGDAHTALVCAHCNDRLTLSSESTAPEAELVRRRIWALRCGHMLDGKCIQELMKPAPPPPLAIPLEESIVTSDPKGKRKAVDVPSTDVTMDAGETDVLGSNHAKGKGGAVGKGMTTPKKGKRKAAEMLSETCTPVVDGLSADAVVSPPDDNSMRSRLRPRHPRTSAQGSQGVEPGSASVLVLPMPSAVPPLPRRGRGSAATRRKGKGKAKPKLEVVHEWACPVAGCEQVHVSLCIDGEWKMEPERGAIGLFL
ncbi:hypothetical protein C8Q72DRAFT_452327 [Fomitopsis betulina]|nr:hypothetical protein C8Q72DRAFT_452327 [Fomitopsis betulina]